MKKALVVLDASLSEDAFMKQNKLFFDASKNLGISLVVKKNAEIYTYLNNTKVKSYESFGTYDFVFFLDNDVWLARNLEMLGIKVFNSSSAIDMCENKASMYQTLIKNNINIPKTVILPSVVDFDLNYISDFVSQAIDDLGLPLIVKQWYGDYGKGVFLAKTRNDVFDLIKKFEGRELMLQEFISESAGTDIRICVVKNKVVAALRRIAAHEDFRSNLALGGSMEKHIPTYLEQKLAVDACAATGCKFAVVDILKSINGPVVCEVNTSSNITNLQQVADTNIAEMIFKTCLKG